MGNQNNNANNKVPSRRTLRQLIDKLLPTDTDLEAFLIDYFPAVYKELGLQMQRTSKLNILFTNVNELEILVRLHEHNPKQYKENEKILVMLDPRRRRRGQLAAAALLPLGLTASIGYHYLRANKEWRQIGPAGGPVMVVAIDPHNSDIIYAGFDSDQLPTALFESKDAGLSWQALNDPLMNMRNVRSIAVSPHPDRSLFIGTSKGLIKRRHGELKWTIDDLLKDEEIRAVQVSPFDPFYMLSGTGRHSFGATVAAAAGIVGSEQTSARIAKQLNWSTDASLGDLHKKDNDTTSWLTAPIKNVNAISFSARDQQVVLLGTSDSGVFLTKDRGVTWSQQNIHEHHVLSVAISPEKTNHMLAGTDNGLWMTQDGGEKWQQINSIGDIEVTACLFSKTNNEVVYVGTRSGVYVSNDNGSNWRLENRGMFHTRVFGLAENSAGDLFAASDGGGIYLRKQNTDSWISRSRGLQPGSTLAIEFLTDEHIYIASSYGIFVSNSGGDEWRPLWFSLGEAPAVLAVIPDAYDPKKESSAGLFVSHSAGKDFQRVSEHPRPVLIAGTMHGRLIRSIDGGQTWSNVATVEGEVSSLLVLPQQKTRLLATSNGQLHVSEDSGASWRATTHKERFTVLSDAFHSAVVYAGTNQGKLLNSVDNGSTWSVCPGNFPQGMVMDIAVSIQDPKVIYIAIVGKGIYRSEDQCSSWQEANNGINDMAIITVSISPIDKKRIYAGSITGDIFQSKDGGHHWTISTKSLAEPKGFNRIRFAPSGKSVFAAARIGLLRLRI